MRATITSECAQALRARGGDNPAEVEQLERCAGVLGSIAEEIRASEQVAPWRHSMRAASCRDACVMGGGVTQR